MTTRRSFFRQTAAAASALALPAFLPDSFGRSAPMASAGHQSADTLAQDEDFWAWVKSEYTVSPNLLNLNNGGVCPQPKVVQDAHIRFYQYANEAPSYYMWRILDQGREALRSKLADLAGCQADELAINRNATEGLNTVIFGLNLKAGDEVVLSKQDYPNMLNAWKQREKRDGIKLVYLNLDLPSENPDALAAQYINAFTPRTKVVHVTHLVNWVGQVLPVRKIADEAHKRGIDVIADGAHSFALFDFTIPDLGADYFATSLHKWLGAPFGSGLLYVRKPNISKVWALLSSNEPDGADIRKFESLGTRSFASEMAIGTAVDFHQSIGSARKFARAHYLKNYWMERVKTIPGVRLHTSFRPEYAGAVGLFSIEGMKPAEVDAQLMNQFKIHTVGIDWENIHGVRVTPQLYHTPKDLDRLVAAIDSIAGKRTLAQKKS